MWLEVGNNYSRVARATEAERSWLRSYLLFDDASGRFRKRQNTKVSMFNDVTDTFPTGFVNLIRRAIVKLPPEETFPVQIIDKRVPPCTPDRSQDVEWLRHHPAALAKGFDPITHQIDSLEACIKYARGILWIPTGGGKTEVFAGLARVLRCRWVFLVDSAQLVDNAAERFELRTGEKTGRIGEGVWTTARVTCATFQSLRQALEPGHPKYAEARMLVDRCDGLVIDESHTLPADSFWSVAMKFANAYYRIGMSGTPLARGDRRSVLSVAALGNVIFRVPAQELVRIGVLARPKIKLVQYKAHDTKMNTWPMVYEDTIVTATARNRLVLAVAQRAAKPGLVFVTDLMHGRILTRLLALSGLNVEFVWGDHSVEQRKGALRRLVRADLDFVVCSTVFNKGIDVPSLRSCINAAAGKSIIATLQKLGRGGRAHNSKVEFEVWDFADKGHRWLVKHTKQRLKAYASEGYETVVTDVLPWTSTLALGP